MARVGSPTRATLGRLNAAFQQNPRARWHWAHYCFEEGGRYPNPKHCTEDFLLRFLEAKDWAQVDLDDTPSDDLVLRVQLQFKERAKEWTRYAAKSGFDLRDPRCHSPAFLEQFLQDFETARVDAPTTETLSRQAAGVFRGRFSGLDGLFERNPRTRWYWARHCYEEGGGMLKPVDHTEGFLLDFLESMDWDRVDLMDTPSEELVQQVIERLETNRRDWRKFIKEYGYGLRGPSCHSPDFLEHFLEVTS